MRLEDYALHCMRMKSDFNNGFGDRKGRKD